MSGQRKPPAGVKPVNRLIDVRLDEATLRGATRDIEHEREAAIYDLLEQNHFALHGTEGGPYALVLSLVENRLVFDVTDMGSNRPVSFHLSLSPLRRVVKDYFLICESYYDAIRQAPLSRIEAIDMGRRGLHDEGTQILMQRLEGKIDVDFDTARRLFTLICVLHWRG